MKKVKENKKEINIKNDFDKIEKIIGKLEGQKIGLDESLELFEEGSVLVKRCHRQLKKAKNKFQEIKQDLEKELEE
jgi:exodeoxyribonuclease VII small subunit